jgi:hypothetical protein
MSARTLIALAVRILGLIILSHLLYSTVQVGFFSVQDMTAARPGFPPLSLMLLGQRVCDGSVGIDILISIEAAAAFLFIFLPRTITALLLSGL